MSKLNYLSIDNELVKPEQNAMKINKFLITIIVSLSWAGLFAQQVADTDFKPVIAKLSGPQQRKVGMNSENAGKNYQLLLNIIHWLDGKME